MDCGDKVKVVNCECPEANGLIGTIVKYYPNTSRFSIDFGHKYLSATIGKWLTHNCGGTLTNATGLYINKREVVPQKTITDILNEVKNETNKVQR